MVEGLFQTRSVSDKKNNQNPQKRAERAEKAEKKEKKDENTPVLVKTESSNTPWDSTEDEAKDIYQ
jgi:hypothetical protein